MGGVAPLCKLSTSAPDESRPSSRGHSEWTPESAGSESIGSEDTSLQ
jgi:hypothetical protein